MRGCIVKRGKSSWAVVVNLGRDPQTGKRRQKWYSHKTRREADIHLAHLVTAIKGGTYTPETKLTLAEYLDQWLRDYAESHVGPVTLRDYRTIAEKHLKPELGRLPLPAISAQAIDRHCAAKLRAGLSPGTVHKQYRVLHEVLEHAVRWGLLQRNPADMARPPKMDSFELKPWDEEEVRVFLGEAKRSSRLYPLYLTALLTGMRLGELLGLRWEDVDLAAGTLRVQQTLYRLHGSKKEGRKPQLLFKKPKSRASQRTIALPPAVVEALRGVQREQDEARTFFDGDYQEHRLVFTQPNGKPLHAHNLSQRDFQRIIEDAKLRRIRFHDLRHCHASHLARAGVSVKVAQERLGHSTPTLTLRIYTHTLAGQHEEAAQAVQDLILSRNSAPRTASQV